MIYLRQVRDRLLWSERLPNAESEARQEAIDEFLFTSFASVYTAASDKDVQRIALAISAMRSNRQTFRYIEIAPHYVKELGIFVVENPGNTPLDDVNCLHRDLKLNRDQAGLLIDRLVVDGISVKELKAGALKRLARGALGVGIPNGHWLVK